MSGIRKRLADMSFRMINVFKDPEPLRFYKANIIKLEGDESYQRIFNKNEYTEFIGVIIDIKPQELAMLYMILICLIFKVILNFTHMQISTMN